MAGFLFCKNRKIGNSYRKLTLIDIQHNHYVTFMA